MRAILVDFDADFQAGSLDEAYLDVTDYCQQHSLTGDLSSIHSPYCQVSEDPHWEVVARQANTGALTSCAVLPSDSSIACALGAWTPFLVSIPRQYVMLCLTAPCLPPGGTPRHVHNMHVCAHEYDELQSSRTLS